MTTLSVFGYIPQYEDFAHLRATTIVVDDLDIVNSLDVTGNIALTGNLTMTGDLAVTGNTTLTGNLTLDGFASYIDAQPQASPAIVGSAGTTTENIWDVDVEGDLLVAVVFSSDKFVTFDVSDPTTPVQLGSLQSSTTIDDPTMVRLKGDYAYVVTGDNVNRFLTVYDVSDPTTPVRYGFVADPSTYLDGTEGFEVQGKYAYATGADADTFSVWDIGDPANPAYVSSVTDASDLDSCSGIAIKGKYAFVCAKNADKFTTVDISDPLSPTVAATIADATDLNGVFKVFIDGNIAYVTCRIGDTLTLLDISDPLAVTVLSSVATSEYPWKVEVLNDLAYVTCKDTDSFQVIDVSDSSAPAVLRTLTDSTNLDRPQGFRVQGNYAYVATGDTTDSIVVIDLLGSRFPHVELGSAKINKATVTGELHVQGSTNFQNGVIIGQSGLAVHGDTSISGRLKLVKGAVTQITSITTNVTLHDDQGIITTVSSTLAATSTATFTVTNNRIIATDAVLVNIMDYGGSAGIPNVIADNIAAGSFDIIVSNSHASAALDGTLEILFVLI